MSDEGTPNGQQGDPQAGQGAASGQDPAGGAPTPTPPANGQQNGNSGDGDGGQDPAGTIARLERELADARKDAGKARTTAKQRAADEAKAELAQQIGRALGIVEDGTPPDPDALARQLADEQNKARQTAVELAVYRTAQAAGADPDALLDSRQFAAAVADLDPSDNDAIKAAVQQAVEANPRLAAQQAPAGPPRGGAEFGGPPSDGITPQQFAAMGYGERAELYQSDPDTYRRLAGK